MRHLRETLDLGRSGLIAATFTLTFALPLGVASAQVVQVAAGPAHTLVLGADGQITGWGSSDYGELDVPALPPGVTYSAIATGGSTLSDGLWTSHSLALRSDGQAVAWGWLGSPADVPALPPGLEYTAVATGTAHALALRSDGQVVAWGDNGFGQCDVPALPAGLTYVEISAGGSTYESLDWCQLWPVWNFSLGGLSVARRSDGSVVVWGQSADGLQNVPALPPGVTYVEIAAGADHVAARRSDGAVVAWGDNTFGQCDVPAPPAGLEYVAVDAGAGDTTAVLSDGTLLARGIDLPVAYPWLPYIPAPPLPTGVGYVDVAVGGTRFVGDFWDGGDLNCTYSHADGATAHVVALRSDGAVVAWGDNSWYQVLDPWTELGGGTPGSAGTPALVGFGTPLETQPVSLYLSDAPPSALTLLWISVASSPVPVLGGTLHTTGPAFELLLTTYGGGGINLPITWPAGIPSGTELWLQFVVQDDAVAPGLTLSNGLRVEVP